MALLEMATLAAWATANESTPAMARYLHRLVQQRDVAKVVTLLERCKVLNVDAADEVGTWDVV